jgi:hypothetical protein
MHAESYDVLVDAEVAPQAIQLLDAPTAPGRGMARRITRGNPPDDRPDKSSSGPDQALSNTL